MSPAMSDFERFQPPGQFNVLPEIRIHHGSRILSANTKPSIGF